MRGGEDHADGIEAGEGVPEEEGADAVGAGQHQGELVRNQQDAQDHHAEDGTQDFNFFIVKYQSGVLIKKNFYTFLRYIIVDTS